MRPFFFGFADELVKLSQEDDIIPPSGIKMKKPGAPAPAPAPAPKPPPADIGKFKKEVVPGAPAEPAPKPAPMPKKKPADEDMEVKQIRGKAAEKYIKSLPKQGPVKSQDQLDREEAARVHKRHEAAREPDYAD